MTPYPESPGTGQFLVASEQAGLRLDQFLAIAAAPLSRSRLKALILEGAVTCAGMPAMDPNRAVSTGEAFYLVLPAPVPATPEPQEIALDIVFEDAHLIVINKPAGMAMHPAPGSEDATLVNALLHHCKGQLSGIGGVERPGIVHRIDKLTTGLVVAAKTETAHVKLAEQFAAHTIDRVYFAITRACPRPQSGTIDARLARSTADRKKIAVVKSPVSETGRRAVTHYQVSETFGLQSGGTGLPAAALVRCKLETGRTHQVRVHMAHIGCPLIGDPVYGRARALPLAEAKKSEAAAMEAAQSLAHGFARQALHASVLGFVHPACGEAMRFESPLPDDMGALIAALEKLPKR